MILDVLPGTPAQKKGLRSHDVILTLNGQPVNRFNVMQELLLDGPQEIILEVKRGTGNFTQRMPLPVRQDLGIIPVPEPNAAYYLSVSEDGIFSIATSIWRRIRNNKFTS
jgi:C-terminal processing protease CtpA/Prc